MLELSHRFIQTKVTKDRSGTVDPELTKDRPGTVDFFIPNKKWGVELLHKKEPADILKHCGYFADQQDQHAGYFNKVGKYAVQPEQRSGFFNENRKYAGWNKMDDFIIINFCGPSLARDLADIGPFFFVLIA